MSDKQQTVGVATDVDWESEGYTRMYLSTAALGRLRSGWESGNDRAVVAAVRDLFDGQDGTLMRLRGMP